MTNEMAPLGGDCGILRKLTTVEAGDVLQDSA